MITKRISGQQKQPGSFILQAEPLSRSYHVAESICRIYNRRNPSPIHMVIYFGKHVWCEKSWGCNIDHQHNKLHDIQAGAKKSGMV